MKKYGDEQLFKTFFSILYRLQDLISTPFQGITNALSWSRELVGDFEEIVHAIAFEGTMLEIDEEDLLALELSEAGKVARETILSDFRFHTESE